MISANLLAVFYLISGVLFILALRGLSSPETSRQGNLYAKNLFNFVMNLYDKKDNKININLEDEIINKTLVK